jgi:hypothetical protein
MMSKARAAAESGKRLFPEELQLVEKDLLRAATMNADDPLDWPEGEKVIAASGPKEIAKILVRSFHLSIRQRPIAYLWKENMGDGTRVKLGTARKASADVKFLGNVDFILHFNHSAYKVLTAEQRIALVDHELQHCEIDTDSGQPCLVPHDVEEFGVIVHRWGLWKPDLLMFGDIVRRNIQPDLWDQVEAPPKASEVTSIAEKVVEQVNAGALGKDVTARVVRG